VGLHYGARAAGGLLDGWLVDDADTDAIGDLEAAGIRAVARPLLMDTVERTMEMARAAIALAGSTQQAAGA
jgi:LPPG:FO 2-phospho-L-lactate transferase